MTAASRPFLTAEWRNLAIISYAIEPAVLAPLCPPGLEPDVLEGQAFVSLVAFDFLNTRVLGVRWPGFVNFPEVNLRFYVRESRPAASQPPRRGVCFIKELVPSRVVSFIARVTYGEPYESARMSSRADRDGHRIAVRHDVTLRGNHSIVADAGAATVLPTADSTEHWFKEHEWGFGRSRSGRTVVYRVEHPVWRVHAQPQIEVNVDYAKLYGPRWAMLNARKPAHHVLAEGSAVAVLPAGVLE